MINIRFDFDLVGLVGGVDLEEILALGDMSELEVTLLILLDKIQIGLLITSLSIKEYEM